MVSALWETDDGLEDKVEPHLDSVQPQPKAYAAPGLRTHDGYEPRLCHRAQL